MFEQTTPIPSPTALARALAISGMWALVAATPAHAQTSGNPVTGKLLYEDTPNQVNNQQINACVNCHTVESRRQLLSGNQFGPVPFATAQSRLQGAINANTGGMGQFSVLSAQEVVDLAGYLSDTPKTSATQLDFAPGAVNVAASLPLDLTHAIATSATIRVTSVAISGTNASDFSVTSDACSLQTLNASGTCRVTVRFMSATTAGKSARITFTLDPSNSTTNFTREVVLTGAVAVAAPPPAPAPSPAPAPATDTGGGSLGWPWLAALAAAVAATRRATRRTD
jgi:cytochrome c553